MRCRAAEGAHLPQPRGSEDVKGPTNTSSFLRVQQGGEVEAAPDLAAAQGPGARHLWLSQKRQVGGPGESALSFGTDTLPVSVGAQRVRRGACTGQGGRIDPEQVLGKCLGKLAGGLALKVMGTLTPLSLSSEGPFQL